ncbi:MAG: hypothetical protein IJU19_01750 [Bacteroidales bacterium]|nr:hypothetical protein [Bacteroidales bacterium]
MDCARGRWLLFADADDYFAEGAIAFFLERTATEADVVYTCMAGWDETKDAPCDRGEIYVRLVQGYLKGERPEKAVRYQFHSPCCKMIRRQLVADHGLRFSEVRTGNDALFSVGVGYWARKIEVVDRVTYVATISGNNISRRWDFDSVICRYEEDLKINRFMRRHGEWRWQLPILEQLKPYGWRKRIKMLRLAIHYGQPLMVDCYSLIQW